MATHKFEEFYVVWESSCRNFIDEVRFATEEAERSRLKVHIFLRRDTPAKAMPPAEEENKWIMHHFSLTSCPYASDTAIVANIIQNYSAPILNGQTLPNTVYLVCERERQYDELVAILTTSRCRGLNICQVDGRVQSIYDIVSDSCKVCKLIFGNEDELKEHNLKMHDCVCNNATSSRGRFFAEEALSHKASQLRCPNCKGNASFTDEEWKMRAHDSGVAAEKNGMKVAGIRKMKSETSKLFCEFCPAKVFSSSEQREIHLRHSHKKCNCSCGKYFATREDYIGHFYKIYPLGCFENRKCPQRFQSVAYQARHHRESHNALHPFYCVPCHRRKVEEGARQRVCFKDEKSLRIHGMSMGHNEEEMFLNDPIDSLKVDAPDQRRSPTRTCSAINFC